MTMDQPPLRRQSDTRPVPDPTDLTTEAIRRDLAALKELLEAKIDANKEMTLEKFRSHDDHFALVENQRVEQKADTEKAVTAALTAQKEANREQKIASDLAINKSETATKEQLNQLTATFNAAIQGVINEMSGVKERVGKIENVKVGIQERRSTMSASTALAGTVVAIVVGVATLVITIIART